MRMTTMESLARKVAQSHANTIELLIAGVENNIAFFCKKSGIPFTKTYGRKGLKWHDAPEHAKKTSTFYFHFESEEDKNKVVENFKDKVAW